MNKILIPLTVVLLICSQTPLQAQTFSNKVVGDKNADVIDSLKNLEYPYVLPILGKKATKAGFDLPYPFGININYLWQKSDIVINNLEIGFNNGPKYNMDEIVSFNGATSESNALNFRPDFWLFPFLNIYGIFAKSKTSTNVDININVPDSDSWKTVASFQTEANFNAFTTGFGITPTIGIGGGWLALDMNFGWTDIDELDRPVKTFIFDPRLGKAFKFKKQQMVAIWVGGFRLKINSGTSGSLPIGDLFNTEGLDTRIENGLTEVDQSRQEVDAWWDNLTPVEQTNPVNKAKYETANRTLDAAGNMLNSFSDGVDRLSTSTVQYSLDKKQEDLWNFIVGAQYQLNKHWMIRGEFGFVEHRNTFVGGLQYRFGL